MFVFGSDAVKNSFTNAVESLANKTMLLQIENNKLIKFDGNIKNLNLVEFNNFSRIEEIASRAFENNINLNSLILPASVKILGENFINGCENLSTITINSNFVPNFIEATFAGCKENLTLYVPEKALNVYKKALENFDFTILSIN